MKSVLTIAAVILFSAAFVAAFVVGTGRSEVMECNKWNQEADAYPGFYLAHWQKDQCDAHGIVINAPVK